MKHILILSILLILAASVAHSGEIFGNIKENNKPVAKGIKIEIISPKKTYTAETDSFGSYRIFVTEKGKCAFKLNYNKQTPTFDIFSYDKSTRYDFIIETIKDKYILRRK
jgi:hypothetical protein